MCTLKEQFLFAVVAENAKRAVEGRPLRVLDLGCGTASYVPALLAAHPSLVYVGVEPIAASFALAQKNLVGYTNATVHFQLGYDAIPQLEEGSFDLVFSLSVLEHIKHLDRFIAFSARYARAGGSIVHRYDLGHALYPSSIKERVHVYLGNTVPALLPERQFVRYVSEEEVKALYLRSGITPIKSTYHQMPSHKSIEKQHCVTQDVVDELFAWETKHQSIFATLATSIRERLFPSIAVWGQKE
jgi:SAM-dependent methyltransferase